MHSKQLFKKRLMSSFMAAMLIIKMVKMKLIFLLPLLVGVTTAKKILLKVLLFLFPALAHLFKLCAYYHHQHTKYHLHHHHQVAHHHHHPAPTIYIPPPSHEYDYPPPGAEIIHKADPTTNELSSWGIDYQGPINGEQDSISRLYSINNILGGSKLYGRPSRYKARRRRKRPSRTRSRPSPYRRNSIPSQQALPVQATAPLHLDDPFYSPILTKLDRVFLELGFTDEPCKERLVCSMYKAPERFSPHSNLVSAEISRDPSELQKPLYANPAVIRFFRYVQAARNGQDMKDCLTLYPACSLLTE
ncbi:uncharacterized protein isoform X3 [Rhodnius prolixus]|uniref:uncharacterized protein isoform X3 n=1 Tax=Rhodnius prolixus TaxID=13249 RepID=UPI003D18B8CF